MTFPFILATVFESAYTLLDRAAIGKDCIEVLQELAPVFAGVGIHLGVKHVKRRYSGRGVSRRRRG